MTADLQTARLEIGQLVSEGRFTGFIYGGHSPDNDRPFYWLNERFHELSVSEAQALAEEYADGKGLSHESPLYHLQLPSQRELAQSTETCRIKGGSLTQLFRVDSGSSWFLSRDEENRKVVIVGLADSFRQFVDVRYRENFRFIAYDDVEPSCEYRA
jgi:hypothetical protein